MKVSFLKAAIPYQQQLLLFSEQTQFVMSGNDLLHPEDRLHQTPGQSIPPRHWPAPITVGGLTYFVTNPGLPGGFASIYEITYDKRTESTDSAESTAHVPSYIPDGVFRLAGSVDESVVVALTRGAPGNIYVYPLLLLG